MATSSAGSGVKRIKLEINEVAGPVVILFGGTGDGDGIGIVNGKVVKIPGNPAPLRALRRTIEQLAAEQ
jgi:hypothetical protein